MAHRWTIAFDADDTLWHNERFFKLSQKKFADLLSDYVEPDHLHDRLLAAERKNIAFYGFGIKGFTLSMIETALEVTEGRVSQHVIQQLLDNGREMLRHPIELLEGVGETIPRLAADYDLLVITKGDLLDQERKVAQSGLGDHFSAVEIVSDKTAEVYQRIFARHDTARVMMVGNSLKSDVIPAIEAGAWGVYVPHELTWEYEKADEPDHARFCKIRSLNDLPDLIAKLG
ncbi:HAD family hydrolase [Marivivens aquimaris]|uniref:HAD family hydrolase n=1 Tax=Marivivens aquimaris TaxID=2774876 RepID=UPI00187FAEBA|nr:HAD family hydrolase [Marivivens aquimaris]